VLRPEEFTVGEATDAEGLTLLLPRSEYERPLLVVEIEGARTAVILDEQFPFHSFGLPEENVWRGVLVKGVQIEIDQESLVDIDGFVVPPGVLVREEDRLSLSTWLEDTRALRRRLKVPLVTGLSRCSQGQSAAFSRWRIVIGEGIGKRVLKEFPLKTADGASL